MGTSKEANLGPALTPVTLWNQISQHCTVWNQYQTVATFKRSDAGRKGTRCTSRNPIDYLSRLAVLTLPEFCWAAMQQLTMHLEYLTCWVASPPKNVVHMKSMDQRFES